MRLTCSQSRISMAWLWTHWPRLGTLPDGPLNKGHSLLGHSVSSSKPNIPSHLRKFLNCASKTLVIHSSLSKSYPLLRFFPSTENNYLHTFACQDHLRTQMSLIPIPSHIWVWFGPISKVVQHLCLVSLLLLCWIYFFSTGLEIPYRWESH